MLILISTVSAQMLDGKVTADSQKSIIVGQSLTVDFQVDNSANQTNDEVEIVVVNSDSNEPRIVQLGIGISLKVDTNVKRKLEQRKIDDEPSFQAINTIVEEINENDQNHLTDDLIEMDKEFVKNLASNQEQNQEQITDYVKNLKNDNELKVDINDANIELLFEKEISMDDFIDLFWN